MVTRRDKMIKEKHLSMRMTQRTYDNLKVLSEKAGVTKTDYVHHLLISAYEKYIMGEPDENNI